MAKLDDLKSDLLLCTVYVQRLIRAQSRNSHESFSELSVLNNLDHWGRVSPNGASSALTPKELAAHDQVSQAAMSNTLKKLRKREFVRNYPSEADSRSVFIGLTNKGRKHLAQQGPIIKSVMDDCLSKLSPAELATVAAGQRLLAQALTESQSVQSVVAGVVAGNDA